MIIKDKKIGHYKREMSVSYDLLYILVKNKVDIFKDCIYIELEIFQNRKNIESR